MLSYMIFTHNSINILNKLYISYFKSASKSGIKQRFLHIHYICIAEEGSGEETFRARQAGSKLIKGKKGFSCTCTCTYYINV